MSTLPNAHQGTFLLGLERPAALRLPLANLIKEKIVRGIVMRKAPMNAHYKSTEHLADGMGGVDFTILSLSSFPRTLGIYFSGYTDVVIYSSTVMNFFVTITISMPRVRDFSHITTTTNNC